MARERIGRSIVDDEELEIRKGLGQDALDGLGQVFSLLYTGMATETLGRFMMIVLNLTRQSRNQKG